MSGKRITTQYVKLYLTHRKQGASQAVAAAKAGLSERTVQWIEADKHQPRSLGPRHWRTRKDPFRFAEVWESEVVSRLEKASRLNATTLFEALQALRGMLLVNAVTLIAELGDLARFTSPRKLMHFLGLTPSEYSGGPSTRRGAITKAGNTPVRGALIEAAWHYRWPPRVSRIILLCQQKLHPLMRLPGRLSCSFAAVAKRCAPAASTARRPSSPSPANCRLSSAPSHAKCRRSHDGVSRI